MNPSGKPQASKKLESFECGDAIARKHVVQNLGVLLITDPWLGVMSLPLKIKIWLDREIH
jgi:hypothetical protein